MKKYIILLFVLVLTGCSESPQESESEKETVSAKKTLEEEMADHSFTIKDVKLACEEGCQYDYQLYTIANSLTKEAVSLNHAQLESIKNACNFFCSKKVFSIIKKEKEKQEALSSVSVNEDVIQEEKPKKVKKIDKSLTPFEEL